MTVWTNENKVEEAHECSYSEDKPRATFILTDELFGVIKHLCNEIQTEWQALLIGEEREDNVVYMNDYYIPKQSVTSASVINNECFTVERITDMGIVTGIHSHGDMKPFFSKTDHDCANTSPIKNNIVVNNKQLFVATKALALPCGMVKFLDAEVVRDMPKIEAATKVRGIKHIDKKSYITYPLDNFGGGMGAWKREEYRSAGWDEDYTRYGESQIKGKRKKHAFGFDQGIPIKEPDGLIGGIK